MELTSITDASSVTTSSCGIIIFTLILLLFISILLIIITFIPSIAIITMRCLSHRNLHG